MGHLLHLDPFAGIAGDMLCAALIDLGADLDQIRQDLSRLPVRGYTLDAPRVQRGVFAAVHFRVHVEDGGEPHDHSHDHGHSHDHVTASEGKIQGVGGHTARPGQPDRRWRSIRAMLEESDLAPRVKSRALAAFTALARAEGRVHGIPPDDVHFHEVGAVDSIVDIVAACLALEQLDVSHVRCGPLPVSGGTITTEHGRIPLPAPATLELLQGWPVRPGVPGQEQVTPTGAALVAALATPGDLPAMTLLGVGYGAGTRNPPDRPNVLRAVLGRASEADSPLAVDVIEAQMDDLTGEHLPPLIDALLAAGALDAFATPTLMKKGRTGILVQALAPPAAAPAVEDALLRHGSTFGVRRHRAWRRVLARRHEEVATPWGAVRVKVGALNEEDVQASPEFEDVLRVARASGQPVPRVHAAALAAWHAARR